MIKRDPILVSHSGKQYVHRFIQALLVHGWPVIFCTPIWFLRFPQWLNWLPPGLRKKLKVELGKRYFSFSNDIRLVMKPGNAIAKELSERIGRVSTDRAQFNLEKKQDEFGARQLTRDNPKIVVGYEISSLETFHHARSRKCVTVLDLAQIHYDEILEIAHRFPEMNYILRNPKLAEINERKQAEYELADYIITLSSYARETLITRGFPSEKVYKVSLGFDVALFTPKIHYNPSRSLRLMICGTDMTRKGLGLLLSVVGQMQHDGYELELTVIGPITEIKKVIKSHPRINDIKVIPFLPHTELVNKYHDNDVFVFPSYLDSWAMTVLEAMACGTPVIVTENTGSMDAVKKGGGLIIKTGDDSALQDAISFFYDDRSRVEQLGKAAREVAIEYTWENYYNEVNSVLLEISNKSGIGS